MHFFLRDACRLIYMLVVYLPRIELVFGDVTEFTNRVNAKVRPKKTTELLSLKELLTVTP